MERHQRIDPRRLRVLLQLRQCGTITAAARTLALTTSAVSQQLSTLADELGVPLLVRQGRRVRLTPQAEILVGHAQAIDWQLERALADLAAFEAGTLGQIAVGGFSTAILALIAPALERVRARRPGLQVIVHQVAPAECYSSLDRGDLDVAVTVDYRKNPPQGDGRYWRQELLEDPFLVALPRDHRLAARSAVDLRSLAKEGLILERGAGPCQDAILAAFVAAGVVPTIRHHVGNWAAVLRLVTAGCGVGVIPALALSDLAPPRVALRPPAGSQRFHRRFHAVVRAGAEHSPCIVPVLEALADVARVAPGQADGPELTRLASVRRG